MNWNILTLFPEMIESALKVGVVGQAIGRGEVKIRTVNPRQFTDDVHHTVDDRPFGGGDGMVLLYRPWKSALDSLGTETGHKVLLSAHGRKWNDARARELAQRGETVTLICGRYGGFDQRFINQEIDEEISIGDFILSGGELAALVVVDSVVRLRPGVLGNVESADSESFADGLLEAPLFTRPRDWPEAVPQVFLSGDHRKIARARRALALFLTAQKRPDLLSADHQVEMRQLASVLREFFSDAELSVCGLSEAVIRPGALGELR